MTNGVLLPPSQTGELSQVLGRTHEQERREDHPRPSGIVVVNASYGDTLGSGNTYKSARFYCSFPVTFNVAIVSLDSYTVSETVELWKNGAAVRDIDTSGTANMVRWPIAVAYARDDYLQVYAAPASSSPVGLQVQLRGTAKFDDFGALTFDENVGS